MPNRAIEEVLDQIAALGGQIESFAFAIVRTDGVPVFGHANPTYDLLGALEQAKLAMSAKMLRDAEDVPGFEDNTTH